MSSRGIVPAVLLLALAASVSRAWSAQPAQPAPQASLDSLTGLVGKYPHDVRLWETTPLGERLKALLGAQYDPFMTNLGVQGPLARYGDVVWTSGNKPHEGGTEGALLLADTKANTIEVYLLTKGSLGYYREKGANAPLEGDAKTVLANFKQWAAKK